MLKKPCYPPPSCKKMFVIGTDQPAPRTIAEASLRDPGMIFLAPQLTSFLSPNSSSDHHRLAVQVIMAHPQSAFASTPQGQATLFSAFNIIWLLHAATEAPVAFIGLFFTYSLHFKDEITNTTAVIIKVSHSHSDFAFRSSV